MVNQPVSPDAARGCVGAAGRMDAGASEFPASDYGTNVCAVGSCKALLGSPLGLINASVPGFVFGAWLPDPPNGNFWRKSQHIREYKRAMNWKTF